MQWEVGHLLRGFRCRAPHEASRRVGRQLLVGKGGGGNLAKEERVRRAVVKHVRRAPAK